MRGVAVEPAGDVVRVTLLAPQERRERLAHHLGLGRWRALRRELVVELRGLDRAQRVGAFEAGTERLDRVVLRGPQAQLQLHRRVRLHGDPVPPRGLGAALFRVHRGRTVHDVVVDAVLGERRGRVRAEDAHVVGLVVAAEQRGVAVGAAIRVRRGAQLHRPEPRMVDQQAP